MVFIDEDLWSLWLKIYPSQPWMGKVNDPMSINTFLYNIRQLRYFPELCTVFSHFLHLWEEYIVLFRIINICKNIVAVFKPTHLLVSRSNSTPIQLVQSPKGFFLVTESEWLEYRKPAFEMYPQQGFFCQGLPVLGYSLQPLGTQVSLTTSGSAVSGA